jgi:hypothetical protein
MAKTIEDLAESRERCKLIMDFLESDFSVSDPLMRNYD